MKVDYVLRSDFEKKFGGDVIQARHYGAAVEMIGGTVRYVGAGPSLELRRDALVHILNVDRPFDFLDAISRAKGRRIIVSPVHHSARKVSHISQARGRGLRTYLEVLPEAPLELLKTIVRNRRMPRVPALACLVRTKALRRSVASALEAADLVVLLAEGELEDLQIDYGYSGANYCVMPNGATRASEDVPWRVRKVDVLVPGRIEPRKNQVALAQSLSPSLRVVFVGAANARDQAYTTEFEAALNRSPSFSWIGPVPSAEMAAHYASARFVINASFAEVLSLVDLEAFVNGCRLITTTAGNTAEWLGDAARYVRPGAAQEAAQMVDRLMQREVEDPPVVTAEMANRFSWERIGHVLIGLYSEVLKRQDSASADREPMHRERE